MDVLEWHQNIHSINRHVIGYLTSSHRASANGIRWNTKWLVINSCLLGKYCKDIGTVRFSWKQFMWKKRYVFMEIPSFTKFRFFIQGRMMQQNEITFWNTRLYKYFYFSCFSDMAKKGSHYWETNTSPVWQLWHGQTLW